MAEDSCCTCAKLLSSILPQYDEKTEKPVTQDRRLQCCGRTICGNCIRSNSRFATYCPFCQISSDPTVLPQGLRDPPAYSPPSSPRPPSSMFATSTNAEEPPAYSSLDSQQNFVEKLRDSKETVEDVLHFVNPSQDTTSSLALRYSVPSQALRKKNNLYADHLLAARKTILIPGEYYSGPSLSPEPIDGEEEEIRKSKIRRWMVTCKVSDYNIALLYLEQAHYDVDAAVEAYLSDEKWESEHPMASSSKDRPASGRTRWKIGCRLE